MSGVYSTPPPCFLHRTIRLTFCPRFHALNLPLEIKHGPFALDARLTHVKQCALPLAATPSINLYLSGRDDVQSIEFLATGDASVVSSIGATCPVSAGWV